MSAKRLSASFPEMLKVDVYKVGHHGAGNGTIVALLTKTKPLYAVISAGDNTILRSTFSAWDHGHPNRGAIEKLERRGSGTREAKNVL